MPPILMWVLVVVAAAVCGALGYYFGGENRKRTAEAKIGSAEEEAKRIVNDAIKAAEQKRKETIIEAKDEAFKLKADADKEIKDRRAEISRQERRMDQKEEALDKRTAAMERKEEDLKKRGLSTGSSDSTAIAPVVVCAPLAVSTRPASFTHASATGFTSRRSSPVAVPPSLPSLRV